MKLIWRYSRAYGWRFAALLLLVIVQGATQILGLTREMKNIVDQGIQGGNMDYLGQSSLRMILFAAIVGICGAAVAWLGTSIACGVRKDMTRDCYRKIVKLSSEDMARYGGGTLLTRCVNDTEAVQRVLVYILGISLLSPVTTVMMLVSLFRVDRQVMVAQITAAGISLAIMLMLMVMARRRYPRLQNSLDRLNRIVKEKITGVRSIRAYGREEDEAVRGETVDREVRDAEIAANRPLKFISPSIMTIMNLLMVVIIWTGAQKVRSGWLEISTMLLTIQYVNSLIPSLSILPTIITTLPSVEVGLNRIGELLETEDAGAAAAITAAGETERQEAETTEAILEFREVSFAYPGQKDALSGLSFVIPRGARVGVVGATGSGKSTLLQLMCGLLPPRTGKILISGKDAGRMDREEYGALFSYVPQKAVVFQDTVLENIRTYHSEMDEERIRRACDAASFTEVVEGMEQGMETPMAQGGMNLSGGQRKRLSLARGLARDAEIYLLDDPFAALDAVTERRTRENTLRALEGRTLILVTQRFRILADFDLILVMRHGEIVETGTHEELLALGGEYADLARTQNWLERSDDGKKVKK